jgi:hypothetical protein
VPLLSQRTSGKTSGFLKEPLHDKFCWIRHITGGHQPSDLLNDFLDWIPRWQIGI